MQSWLLPSILGLPLLGSALILLLGKNWPKPLISVVGSGAVGLSFAGTLLALLQLGRLPGSVHAFDQTLFSWAVVGGREISLGLLADPISLWFMLVITGVGFLIHVYSAGYMAEEQSFGRYFAELNLFIFAMSLLVLSNNFVGLLIGWSGVGLASFLLIGFWHERPEAVSAAKKAFVINVIGDVGIMLAAFLVLQEFGTVHYAGVFQAAANASTGLITTICLLLLVGAVAKSAQLPLHTWLPDAMQGPTPVSALIHAATMVTAGVYLVARAYPLFQQAPDAMQAVAVIGGLTALVGATLATVQHDIKRVLAFSTMSQVGYMMLAAGVGAYTASLFHFLTHAFFKALLFLGAGIIIHHLHGEQDIRRMGGLGKAMPFTYWTFLAGTLALAGAPLFAGFFSKDEVIGAVLDAGHPVLWGMALLAALLTAFYMFRLFALVFAGQPAAAHGKGAKAAAVHRSAHGHVPENSHAGHGEAPLSMALPVGILALFALAGGYIAIPGLSNLPADFLGPVFAQFSGSHAVLGSSGSAEATGAAHHVNWVSMGATLLLAAVGAHFGVRIYEPARGANRQAFHETNPALSHALSHGYYFDQVYEAVVLAPIRATGRWLGSVLEPKVIDAAVVGSAGAVSRLGTALRFLQSGYARRYALTLFVGLVAVLAYYVLIP